MEKQYTLCVWRLPDDFLSYEAFTKAVRGLDLSSSPGIPYMREAQTNGAWLKWNGIEACEIQMRRLWHDVQLVLEDRWDMHLRVFIKQEPHKVKKAEERRWRLIMAVPLCVQVAWQMLFRFMNDLEIEQAYNIPSQQGAIFVAGGWRSYTDSWRARGLTYGLDKKGWDWTFPFWIMQLERVFRLRMGRGDRIGEWDRLSEVLYRHMFEDPKLVLSDGTIFKQVIPGIMKSGCVNTISTNSHGQAIGHCAVCLDVGIDLHPFPRSCGDDTLQHEKHTYHLDVYKRYGIQIKSVSDTLEFMGHDFPEEGPRPLYWMKHLKRVRSVREEDLAQYLDSMARMYCHTDKYVVWEELANQLGYNLPLSREAYKYWYDIGE